ncbi:MAG: NFACT family protein [Clostridia bacterium]|nr:NFACT family protein [Clostridia bacterium]
MPKEKDMSIDGLTIRCITNELQFLIDSKIEKIYEPTGDSITMLLHTRNGKVRLYLSSNANDPRVHTMEGTLVNPEKAPNFCMVLRKHLINGKLRRIEQTGLDRVMTFVIENKDELGILRELNLMIEMMGKYSNIILADSSMRIMDSIKHVSIDTSSKRQILPGTTYFPIPSGKLYAFSATYEDYLNMEKGPVINLGEIFEGISFQYSKEILSHLGIPENSQEILSEEQFEKTIEIIAELSEHPEPRVYSSSDGTPLAYSIMPLTGYGSSNETVFESVDRMLDHYFSEREKKRLFQQEAQRLKKIISKNLSHVQKKMKIHLEDLSNKDKIDRFLLYGELLSANIYLLKRGQKSAEVLNYYTGENIEIPMDQKLSPSSNVNSYFRRAQKLKTAASLSKEKYEQEKDEAGFLENLVYDIDASKTMEDLSDIRNILINYKYIDTDARTKKIKQRDPLEDPIEYTTTSGKKVLVGRNSRQNEVLTLRIADGDDMWFHVKDMPGSHVILFTGGKEPTEQDIYECAIYASRHSRHNDLNKVSIDYTEARNVWKEKGSRLGMVLYRNYRTIVVNPTDRI